MSDIKRIKGSKIKEVKLKEGKSLASDVEVEKKAIQEYSNQEVVPSRKLKQSVDSVKIDVENSNKVTGEVLLSGRREIFYGEKFHKIGTRRIRKLGVSREEKKLDREIEGQDNLSIMVMIIILVLCFIVGIMLGYMLYRIAMNSSNVMFIIAHYLH